MHDDLGGGYGSDQILSADDVYAMEVMDATSWLDDHRNLQQPFPLFKGNVFPQTVHGIDQRIRPIGPYMCKDARDGKWRVMEIAQLITPKPVYGERTEGLRTAQLQFGPRKKRNARTSPKFYDTKL